MADAAETVAPPTNHESAARSRSRISGSIRPGRRRSSKFSTPAHESSAASTVVAVVPGRGEQRRAPRRPASPSSGSRRRLVDGVEVEPVQVEQPGQLRHRIGVVVHPEVDLDVVPAVARAGRGDHERGRLPAAAVAARLVAGAQHGQQPLGQPLAPSGAPGGEHRVDDLGAGQDVALHGDVAVGDASGPGHAVGAGVRRGAVGRHHTRLPAGRLRVAGDQRGQGVLGRPAVSQQGPGLGAVGDVCPGLGGDRARAGPRRRGRRRPTARNLLATATPYAAPSRPTTENVMSGDPTHGDDRRLARSFSLRGHFGGAGPSRH